MLKKGRKLGKLAMRVLAMGLAVLAVFYVFRSSARAEEDDTSSGDGDVTATVPLTASDGEATITEHTEQGATGNQLDDIDTDTDNLT